MANNQGESIITDAANVEPDTYPLRDLVVTEFEIAEYESDAASVEVTYTDRRGYTYTRTVNIPRTQEGEIDETYFETIQYQQLLNVNHKLAVGVATFKDPNLVEDVPTEEDDSSEDDDAFGDDDDTEES